MSYDRLTTEYLCYLMNRARIDAEGDDGYLSLCQILQATDFFPILEMDENRCGECRALRHDFAEGMEEGTLDILNDELCASGTMMEIFLVLAEKMDFELADSEYEAGTGKWFRELLMNCGLIGAVNEKIAEDSGMEDRIMDILTTINFRKFGWDGEGGLFPIRCPREDQRYSQLTTQMNNYIEENYDIC